MMIYFGIAQLFIRLLKMIIVPTVFFSISSAIISNKSSKKIIDISIKGIILYIFTSICAAIIGVTFGIIFKNILPINLNLETEIFDENKVEKINNLSSIILNIVPTNPVKALASGNLIQIIFFSIIIGFAIKSTPKITLIGQILSECNKLVMIIVNVIIKFSPIGIFSLSTWLIGTQSKDILLSLLQIIILLLITSLAQLILVYIPMIVYKKIKIKKFLSNLLPIQLVAFTTTSSNATLPFSIKISQEKLGISKDTANIILPLGATMNMDGLVLFITSTTILLTHSLNIIISTTEYLVLIVSTVLISIGTAGVPNIGLISLSAILGIFNISFDVFTLFAGIDRFRDMISTTVNVSGDVIITKFLDKK